MPTFSTKFTILSILTSMLVTSVCYLHQSNTLWPLLQSLHTSKLSALSPSSTYDIDGVKCGNCEKKVMDVLKSFDPNAEFLSKKRLSISLQPNTNVTFINELLLSKGNYTMYPHIQKNLYRKFIETISPFKPTISIFSTLIITTLLIQIQFTKSWNIEMMMNDFMGLFFIVFSMFKLTNLSGFVMSFKSYDIISQIISWYPWIYPILELGLGIGYLTLRLPIKLTVSPPYFSYLTKFNRYYIINICTFILMSVSSMGVFNAIREKKQIQCACLGTWFNLPMTWFSFIENISTVIMSLYHILKYTKVF